MGCKAQTTAIAVAVARICNAADRPKQGCAVREGLVQRRPIESASLNLKCPFGLSLSKPCAALRQAQRERFKQIRAVSIGSAPSQPKRLRTRGADHTTQRSGSGQALRRRQYVQYDKTQQQRQKGCVSRAHSMFSRCAALFTFLGRFSVSTPLSYLALACAASTSAGN